MLACPGVRANTGVAVAEVVVSTMFGSLVVDVSRLVVALCSALLDALVSLGVWHEVVMVVCFALLSRASSTSFGVGSGWVIRLSFRRGSV